MTAEDLKSLALSRAKQHQLKAASAYKIVAHMRDVVLTSSPDRPWIMESERDVKYYSHMAALHAREARRLMGLEG